VRPLREIKTVAVPVVQLGILGEKILSFNPGSDFDFGGRGDTKENLYLAVGAGRALTFLDKLTAERVLHKRTRNLVVAATGTGKTVIAALDYVRRVAETGVPPRLLFLAHRYELLEQARATFRHALQDASFGELMVGELDSVDRSSPIVP
jgi:hypothetical protein